MESGAWLRYGGTGCVDLSASVPASASACVFHDVQVGWIRSDTTVWVWLVGVSVEISMFGEWGVVAWVSVCGGD